MRVLVIADSQVKKHQLWNNKCRQLNIFAIKINCFEEEKGSSFNKEIVQERISVRLERVSMEGSFTFVPSFSKHS